MEIIPVIDLKGGQAVRARMGQRELYRPIETPLARTSDPLDVTRGLLSVFPFRTLYVADLDAIEGTGNNDAVLARLRNAHPALELWIDNGVAELTAARRFLDAVPARLVLGPLAACEQRPVGDAHRGKAEDGAELDGKTRAARMVAAPITLLMPGAGPPPTRMASAPCVDCVIPVSPYAMPGEGPSFSPTRWRGKRGGPGGNRNSL